MKMEIGSLRGKCACGRNHDLAVKDIMIEHDAMKKLGGMLREGILSGYHSPVILCDSHTIAAASGQLGEVMEFVPVVELDPDNLHADNHGVARAEAALQNTYEGDPDLILAVGSGTIHDLSRYLAHKQGIDFVSCPTAASVDGFVSTVAAMTWDGVKVTLPAVAPVYVIADTTVFSKAPWRLTASGMADLFGKFTAIVDWKIAHAVTGEYYCERIAKMEMDAIEDVKDCMNDLRGDVSGSEGGGKAEEACAKLMYSLLLSGLAMQMVGNSRPASCAEHHMSHLWEMEVLNGHIDALHGEKVGVGLLEVTKLYKKIADALRGGHYVIEPWKGIETDRMQAAFGPKGLMESMMKENTPDPMAGVGTEQLEAKIPEILRILDEDLPSVEETEALLRRGGCCVTMEDIHLPESLVSESLDLSPYVRNRLSFNRLRKMIRITP